MVSKKISLRSNLAEQSKAKNDLVLRNVDMFVWTSGFHNPPTHTYFNMFVDKGMSGWKLWVKALFTLNICVYVFLWSLSSNANVKYEHHHLLP